MTPGLLSRTNPNEYVSSIPRGSKIDPKAQRAEDLPVLQRNKGSYRFVSFLKDVTDGDMSVKEFDTLLDLAVRDENMSRQQICAQVLKQLDAEPRRKDKISAGVSVRLKSIAEAAA